MARQVMLGGELAKRGLFGGNRTSLDWIVLAACLVAGTISMYTFRPGTLVGVSTGILIYGIGVGVTQPIDLYLSSRSILTTAIIRAGRRARRMAGQDRFIPEHHRKPAAQDTASTPKKSRGPLALLWKPKSTSKQPSKKTGSRSVAKTKRPSPSSGKKVAPPTNAPVSVGSVRWFELETSAGRMVILKHMDRRSRKTKTYFTVTLEVQGTQGGLMRDFEADRPYTGFGRFIAKLASRQSLVSCVQEISRSLPVDMTDHMQWMKSRLSDQAPEVVVQSYGELVDHMAAISEQHRSFFVLKIPQNHEFRRKAAVYGRGDEADAQVIFDEIRRASGWARNLGAVKSVRALDEGRLAALIRSIQDPSFDLDDTFSYILGREHEPLQLNDCWQSLDWSSPSSTVVNQRWHHRTGYFPPDAFTADEVSVRSLKGLVSSDREGGFIRTISVPMNVYDAKKARQWAVGDVTSDRASNRKNRKKVSDGTNEVLLSASQRRLKDLKPGTGHQGAGYGMYVTVSAENPAQLERACQAMEARASSCGVDRIDWLRDEQDVALIAALPLARGLAE